MANIQSPIDYKILWSALKRRLPELQTESARKSMEQSSSLTDHELHRLQGEYRAYARVEAEMDLILNGAREENRISLPDSLTSRRLHV